MDGVLWQTEVRPELFTGFGPSAYFLDQPKLETLDVTMEEREVRRRRQIDRATAFLDGEDLHVLEQMETAMREASERHDYERAISHRDALQELTYLFDQLQLFRDVARDFWFVYPIRSAGASNLWNLIAGGDVVAVAAEPGTNSERKALGALLEQTFMQRDRQIPLPFEKYDRVRLVASWFRQHPEELEKVVSPENAMACCRTRAGA